MTSSTAMSRARLGALVATACVTVAVLVPAPALAATSMHSSGGLAPADASGAPGGDGGDGGDGGGTDGSPSGPQPPFGGSGSSGGSSSSGSISDPSGPSDPDSDDNGVPHPLPGNHGGRGGTNVASPSAGATDSGVVSQVSDFVQNLLRSISSFLGSNSTSPASSGTGTEKPAKPSDTHSGTDDQVGAPKQDRVAAGSTNSEHRANRQQAHTQPTVDDVVFSVQSGVDRLIGSVVRR